MLLNVDLKTRIAERRQGERLRTFNIAERDLKEVTGVDYRFMSTMFALDSISGKKLHTHISQSQGAKKK